MKNKKLLTRLFALLASLILVLALAIPCFAEETEQPSTDYIYKRIYGSDELASYFLGESGAFPCVVREYNDRDTYGFGELSYNLSNGGANIAWNFYDGEGVADSYIRVSLDSASVVYSYTYNPFDGDSITDTFDITWDDFELYIMVPVSSALTDPTIPSSDMYSNLFNILKDAVYGSDAELTGSQEYALTLISTILTYATILLPILLVIGIVVWCFKRF